MTELYQRRSPGFQKANLQRRLQITFQTFFFWLSIEMKHQLRNGPFSVLQFSCVKFTSYKNRGDILTFSPNMNSSDVWLPILQGQKLLRNSNQFTVRSKICVCVCGWVCVRVCVREREREREKDGERERKKDFAVRNCLSQKLLYIYFRLHLTCTKITW